MKEMGTNDCVITQGRETEQKDEEKIIYMTGFAT